ncbi:TBC1 domain family member 15-like isoform X1 [Salvia splendens]|uniref:TBC1 domain family member 15-like isoform X1 n=2 Tax=Salvia splendens TaxID=180675 RepID=UPI001C251503|nr:TBC1 domain family member 15-like isoform X1 [Salvia splendens]
MHEPDLSDDADYAASIQHGPLITNRNDSLGRSSPIDPEGAEVVYTKDNVTIHPTQFASERISGRLKLIKQGNALFMTWLPYKGQSSKARLPEKDKNLYTIRAMPFSDIRSIRRHTPALGWQYIIVVMSSGLAFPPLYFYNGGVREFLTTIKQHVVLVRSADDANVFLVNDFQNPLQRTLSSLELPRAVTPVCQSPTTMDPHKGVLDKSSNIIKKNGRRQKYRDPAHDISVQVLEKFSLVTRFARETTSQLFRDRHPDSFTSNEGWKDGPSSHASNHITSSDDSPQVLDEVPVAADSVEIDKLSLVWGKPRQAPLGQGEWTIFLDAEGRVMDPKSLKKRIFYGGVEHNLRKEVWRFLLGYHTYDSTFAEREYLISVKQSEYETIKRQWQSISPDQAKRFTKFRERKGLIDKDVVRTDRSLLFYDGDDNPNVYIMRDILLTYSFYNFDLGYCQGMSDLLSPILYVMRNESESFWCFVHLMERLGPNFNRDQSGMHSQLFALTKLVQLLDSPLHNYFEQNDCLNYFFCFRWLLIQFKREFEYDKTMRIWEVLWTHHLSEHLHLYVCVAILRRYRTKIMGEQMDFDTLLKFINELSGQIDLDSTLREAEALCICAGENGAACIPPGTPPSLPVEDGSVYPQLDDDIL